MPCIQKEELPQILAIAQCIAVHCVANGPEFDRSMDFATAPLVANRKIRIAPVAEQFTDPDFYAASSLIELRIPNQGCVKFRTRSMPAPDSIVVLLTSMIAHEIVHERQELEDQASYQRIVGEQSTFAGDGSTLPREWFDGYYNSSQECEAHAMQAAVTLWAEAQLAGQTQLAVADPMTTDVDRRAKRTPLAG